MIQDTSFIIVDPGHAKMDEPRGDEEKNQKIEGWKLSKKKLFREYQRSLSQHPILS